MQTSANTTTPTARIWNGDTTHLGWVILDNQPWTVHAHLATSRYEKYDYELASLPAIIGTPDEQIISYPVPDRESVTTRVLLHAPHYLTRHYPHLAGAVGWQPRELDTGRVIHEATIATVEDETGLVPIVARYDQALIDIADGDVGDMVARIGTGFDRQIILAVNSMEIRTDNLFRRLAENGTLG